MLPRTTRNNEPDRGQRDANLCGERCRRFTRCVLGANVARLLLIQLCAAVGAALVVALATFFFAIAYVVPVVAKEQVVRADARRIVAAVEDVETRHVAVF